ncbi:MAG: cytochrome c5 family protein [Gammaproteobacteria bacterium]|nr:cytochrome c5 family protein [Gammaproteobacteria bacterium]
MNMRVLMIICSLLVLTACNQESQQRDGQAIYYQSCVSCHDRGHGGAPIKGDTAAWQARLAKGEQQLFENLKNGYNAMPPKGACFDCTDKELKLVLDYLLENKD